MPKYFFDPINSAFLPDELGTECATPEEVKEQAVIAAGEMLRDQCLHLWKTGKLDMFVTDERNNTHLNLSFSAEDLTGAS
jgi:hypothetical protein